MKTISVEVPDNAEDVYEAVTGNSLIAYIQTQTTRAVNAAEKDLLIREAELSKETMLTSAIDRHVVEKAAMEVAEAEADAAKAAEVAEALAAEDAKGSA